MAWSEFAILVKISRSSCACCAVIVINTPPFKGGSELYADHATLASAASSSPTNSSKLDFFASYRELGNFLLP